MSSSRRREAEEQEFALRFDLVVVLATGGFFIGARWRLFVDQHLPAVLPTAHTCYLFLPAAICTVIAATQSAPDMFRFALTLPLLRIFTLVVPTRRLLFTLYNVSLPFLLGSTASACPRLCCARRQALFWIVLTLCVVYVVVRTCRCFRRSSLWWCCCC